MALKRGHIDIDPDYEDITAAHSKRQKVLEEDAKESTKKKIEMIVKKEFSHEIKNKEKELDCIDQRLRQAQLMMDRLRACIIANYYGSAGQQRHYKNLPQQAASIHPAVKDTLGKRPKDVNVNKVEVKPDKEPCTKLTMKPNPVEDMQVEKPLLSATDESLESAGRVTRSKIKKRIVIGNVSKYIPVDRRDENDQSTHKWMVYVRGPRGQPNIDHFVKKVWFFLHPSYRPNDLVEVSQSPFHLTRRGWGEFPVRVQLYFRDQRNKRVDVIHQLKLDRTYTGLQTLGAETVIDVELEKENEPKTRSVGKTEMLTSTATESNITIKEHLSPIKKSFGIDIVTEDGNNNASAASSTQKVQSYIKSLVNKAGHTSPGVILGTGSVNSLTPVSSVLTVPTVTTLHTVTSNTSKLSNVSVTLGTLGSLNSHNIKKTVDKTGSIITNGIKQESVISKVNKTPEPVAAKSSELQKMLLQSTVQTHNSPQVYPKVVRTSSTSTAVQQLSINVAQTTPSVSVTTTSNVKNPTIFVSPNITPQSPKFANISSSPQKTAGQTAAGISNQTLYIRCKDSQGNIFLVPHHLLKTVPNTCQPSASAPNISETAPKTVQQVLIPTMSPSSSKVCSTISASSPTMAIVTTSLASNTVTSSAPGKSQVSKQISVGQGSSISHTTQSKTFFQKPFVQNSQLLVKQAPVLGSKGPIPPPVSGSSPVLLIKTDIGNSVRPSISMRPVTPSIGQTAINTSGKIASTPSQLQLHLQGQISQGQLKVTTQGLKSVPPVSKTHNTTKLETVVASQKTDSSGDNKVPSKNCQLASLLRGDISAAHRNAVKQVSLVNSAAVSPEQMNSKQSVSENISVEKQGNENTATGIHTSSIPTGNLSGGNVLQMKQTPDVVQNKSQNNKLTHSIIIVNQDEISKQKNSPSKSPFQTLSKQYPSKPKSMTGNLKLEPSKINTVNSLSDNRSVLKDHTGLSEKKEQTKTVIAKIGSQTLLLQLPVGELPSNSKTEVKKSDLISSVKTEPSQNHLRTNLDTLSALALKQDLLRQEDSDIQEKKIINVKKKSLCYMTAPVPVKEVEPICIENYPDVQSLVRAAVKRHPIVCQTVDIPQHPYCARYTEQWLKWNVGKRRASEWQRASACRKYLKKYMNDEEMFKGDSLWSVKKIMCWCRLHAYSPHYLEKTLHPTGVDFPLKDVRTDNMFSSVTESDSLVAKLNAINKHQDTGSDDEIDIISLGSPKVKVKEEPLDDINTEEPVIIPPSKNAVFVQELSQRIGVRFEPTPILDEVHGSVSEELLFKVMQSFIDDVIRETFAYKVNMGRYPDGIGVVDVYKALSILPQADFLTNKFLGVKDINR